MILPLVSILFSQSDKYVIIYSLFGKFVIRGNEIQICNSLWMDQDFKLEYCAKKAEYLLFPLLQSLKLKPNQRDTLESLTHNLRCWLDIFSLGLCWRLARVYTAVSVEPRLRGASHAPTVNIQRTALHSQSLPVCSVQCAVCAACEWDWTGRVNSALSHSLHHRLLGITTTACHQRHHHHQAYMSFAKFWGFWKEEEWTLLRTQIKFIQLCSNKI